MKSIGRFFGKKTASKSDLKIYYTSDVHGSELCFLKFLNAGKYYGVDAIILGGDITGKQMVAVIRYPDGHYEADVLGRTRVANTQQEIAELEKSIRFNGMYPYPCNQDELAQLQTNEAYRKQVFQQLMIQSIERWVDITDSRLKESDISCFIMPGNDDCYEIDAVIAQSKCAINPDNKVVELNGYQVLSMAECNPTPWNSPREEPEEKLKERLHSLVAQLQPGIPVIFNLHVPPYNSTLDDAPALTEDLRPITEGGNHIVEAVGSIAVREAIEQVQPVISLHGHIHESRGAVRIGRTLCANPGSEYHDGVLHGVIATLKGEEVGMHQLITG